MLLPFISHPWAVAHRPPVQHIKADDFIAHHNELKH